MSRKKTRDEESGDAHPSKGERALPGLSDELVAKLQKAVQDAQRKRTAQQRQASYATARMDFYHAAFLAGRVMVLLGLIVTLLGFISVIQQDSRRAFRRPEGDASLPRGLPRTPQ